jgi:hypothetical protein
MSRNGVTQMSPICVECGEGCETCAHSDKGANGPPVGSDEVPVFVRRAIALGYDETETWALYRRIVKTRRDIRARRITPAGGCRRVDRLALAVAIADAAGVRR